MVLGIVGVRGQTVEKIRHGAMRFQGMAQVEIQVQLVNIPPPDADFSNEIRLFQFGNNALNRAIRDADGPGDVSNAEAGLFVKANQDVAMIRQEGPPEVLVVPGKG